MGGRIAASVAAVLLVITGIGARGVHAAELRIELSQHDRYVYRSFAVTRTSGDSVARLATIARLDRDAGALVFEDVTGRAVSIPLSEIRVLTFERTLREQAMAVQAARREMTVEVVERKTVTVPAKDIVIDAGALVLHAEGPDPGPIPDERWEARSLAYDGATDAFRLEMERVRYTTTYVGGGGGSSGGTKGLP